MVKFPVLAILTIVTCTETAIIRSPARLSIVDWTNYNYHQPSGFGTYAFGYDIDDPENTQFRNEERHPNGTITGSYGYIDPDGVVRIFNYIADSYGYRVKQETNFN